MIILDRWNPQRLDKKIASHFALTLDQVCDIGQQPAFLEELVRQRAIGERPFMDLADRRDRAEALQQLFVRIPDARVAMKLKILRRIREETLSNKSRMSMRRLQWTILHLQSRQYGEWLEEQNRLAEAEAKPIRE